MEETFHRLKTPSQIYGPPSITHHGMCSTALSYTCLEGSDIERAHPSNALYSCAVVNQTQSQCKTGDVKTKEYGRQSRVLSLVIQVASKGVADVDRLSCHHAPQEVELP